MDKIAVIGDYDSIYGFQTLGLSICPVRDAEEGKEKLRQLALECGIIYLQRLWRQNCRKRSSDIKNRSCLPSFRYRVYPAIQEQV